MNINDLTLREKKILETRFLEEKTLEETGQIFGLSRERIRQIESQVIQKLRQVDKEVDKDLKRDIIKLLKVARKEKLNG